MTRLIVFTAAFIAGYAALLACSLLFWGLWALVFWGGAR